MTDRRGSRFVLEVLFLLALTVALTLANLRPLEIAGIMLVGWVIVAVLEWVAWREEPHYGSGLPPRYYVPQVSLPPAQPLEPVSAGHPEARDEAPTWIASPALRAEMLGAELHGSEPAGAESGGVEVPGEWPGAAPPVSLPPAAQQLEVGPDPWTQAGALPVAPLGELDPQPEPVPEPLAFSPGPEPAFLPPPVSVPLEAARAPQPEPVSEIESEAVLPEAVLPEAVLPEAEEPLDVELARSAQGIARYSLDPLGEAPPRRRFGRGSAPEPAAVEVPARPDGVRALPGVTKRQD